MHKKGNTSQSQRGFGHIGIILVVVAVVAVGGLVAWRFMGSEKNKTASTADTAIAEIIANAKCDYDDKDICKFFASWKAHDSYRMVSTSTDKESGTKAEMTFEIQGDKSHSIMTGDFASETISISDKEVYTKTTDGTWWKQAPAPESQSEAPTTDVEVDFVEPDEVTSDEGPKTTYKALGKEACGNLTCFKYQVVSEKDDLTTEYIWFDTKDYQIRRTTTDNEASSTDTVFSYDNVSVTAPASYKELAPNQYIIPGQSEPQTYPSFQ